MPYYLFGRDLISLVNRAGVNFYPSLNVVPVSNNYPRLCKKPNLLQICRSTAVFT
jgi:hypothetical protein